VLSLWDNVAQANARTPEVRRTNFERESGKPGRSERMTTRSCVDMQELKFHIDQVAAIVVEAGRRQCQRA
jgi:hypothetical protein